MNTIRVLGYGGLVPFVLLPLLGVTPFMDSAEALLLFQLYSCLILGFMAGVLWPVLYHPAQPSVRAVVVVAFPVLSFISFALFPAQVLLIQGGLFLLLRLYELMAGVEKLYPTYYAMLRWQLTGVVVVMHFLYFIVS